jgi:hypothetical protein
MARADLLKQLFQGYLRRDDHTFRSAAEAIIAEERKKHHIVLANELDRLIRNGSASAHSSTGWSFAPPPQDAERGAPLFEIRHPERYLQDLVLADVVRGSIIQVMREFADWDVLEANGLQPAQRVLFCGPSGCGKTATAEAIASELGLPLLYVRFDAVVSSLLGETAANLRKVFDYASRGQWVMLFDEFDAIGRSRDDPTEHGEIKRVVNTFLQIMDGFKGRSLIIAATNFEQALDPAIWRRFDDIVRFERPSRSEVYWLLKNRLAAVHTDDLTVRRLADTLDSATFADAERVAFDIRKTAALRGSTTVKGSDVDEAVRRFTYRMSIFHNASGPDLPSIDKD